MITEHYSNWNGVTPEDVEEIIRKIGQQENFSIVREIFRGMIYSQDKVGSVIYLIRYHNDRIGYEGEPAVLKLQILELEVDENRIIEDFTQQNRNKIVRMSRRLSGRQWRRDGTRGYGYIITEYIDAPHIFKDILATEKEMQIFAKFYIEYLKSIPANPWIAEEKYDFSKALGRVENWAKISRERMGILYAHNNDPIFDWNKNGLKEKVEYYKKILEQNQGVFIKFQHRHLTGNDIRVMPDGSFVVFSNLYWGYAPEWYDTTFHIWASLKSIRDEFSLEDAISYIEKWLEIYKTIPQIGKDSDFERKFYWNLLERMLGIMLVDLIADDSDLTLDSYRRLFKLHEDLFGWVNGKFSGL